MHMLVLVRIIPRRAQYFATELWKRNKRKLSLIDRKLNKNRECNRA
jgi:hypothetical protein